MVAVESHRAREFIAAVELVPEGEQRVVERVLPALARLLNSERASAYALRRDEAGIAVDYVAANFPLPGYAANFERELRHASASILSYDPRAPERSQRNRVMLMPHHRFPPSRIAWFARYDLDRHDQLRVLLCEGSSLLAWVGALREKPFTSSELRTLRAVAPAMRRRLLLERQLQLLPRCQLLGPALEAIGAPAFLLRGQAVVYANAAGEALLNRDRARTIRELQDSMANRSGGYRVTRHASPGSPEHVLAIGSAPAADPAPRTATLRFRWDLTPRQAEVLALVSVGRSNKEIAVLLGCSETTVEFHLTSVLRKAECESRAALVARFWTAV